MSVAEEPPVAVGFVDGQNLFQQAKRLFGHREPDFDPVCLHREVCRLAGFAPGPVRFYTGMPSEKHQPRWHNFWTSRIRIMEAQGVVVTTRPLRYRERFAYDANGDIEALTRPEEKGIDIRIALDMVRLARREGMEAAIIYSQDQDLNEVVPEIDSIGEIQGREILLASAFPSSPRATFDRGIDRTQWIKIDKELYDRCREDREYF